VKKKSYSLRQLRSVLKFRQEDLANMVNIERSTYSKIEKDPWRYSLQLVDDIAYRLNVPVEYLLVGLRRRSPLPSLCLFDYIYSDRQNPDSHDRERAVTLEDLKKKGIIADDEPFSWEDEDD